MNVRTSRDGSHRRGAWLALAVSVLLAGALVELRISIDVPRPFSAARIPLYGLIFHAIAFLMYRLEILLIPTDLLRDELRRRASYLVLLNLAVVLSFISATDLDVWPISIGVFLLAVRVVLFLRFERNESLSPLQRRELQEIAGTWLLWSGFMVAYVFLFFEDGPAGLVWEQTDGRHYHWLSNGLLTLEFEPTYFPLGLALILAPMNLIAGTFTSTGVASLVELNGLSIVFLAFVVSPAAIILLGRTCRRVFGRDDRGWLSWSALVFPGLIALVFAYAWWFQPEFISARDAKYHPIMMFGLTPAVEPFNFLLSVVALDYLTRVGRYEVWGAGALLGMAVMMKETNAIIVLALFFFLWVAGERLWRLVSTGLAAVAVYGPQLAHNAVLHGSPFAPNRSYQWDRQAERWIGYVHERYGIAFLTSDPPRISPAYLPVNAESFVASYWLPLLFVIVATFLLLRTTRPQAVLAAFAGSATASFVLFHLAYIRSGAIFRYLHAILPMAMFVIVGCSMILPSYRTRFRRRPMELSR